MTRKTKRLVFKRVSRGFYWNSENGMSISRELVWDKDCGRKWVAEWKESYMGLMVPSKRFKKFDTLQEARQFLEDLP